MRTRTWMLIASLALFAAALGCHHDAPDAASPGTKPEPGGSATVKKIYNSRCPIQGDPVDPAGETVMYDGKCWGFCCEGCAPTFEKDPAKYVAKYEKEHPDKK